MRVTSRRRTIIFFLVLGICLVALTVALNVGWILLNTQQIALLVLGIVFFALIITGVVLNTLFLIREIRRNEQQDVFLNSVTHELKTPLASMRLYLETLKTRDVSEAKRLEFYDVMLADNNRLLQTVERVLHAGRVNDRRRLLDLAPIKINDLLRECAELVRTRHNLDREALVFRASSDETTVVGDVAELQIAVTNLLDNAVKYSEAKQVKVTVEVAEPDEKSVRVQIKDEGIGISENELSRIFRRFYRVPGIFAQRAKGTGLGLFIVRSIVEKHGGRIVAESRGVGHGSTFTLELPKA